ncbi:hypothetical protein B0T17DRAFT_490526 [Bombardia bombarda]|uniref:Uncharacterized protein n=1 Tax=Bombardia bombarda TaxID=252184 RepID=A0AA40C9H8_9PEZI|nr:hypothetical protein B0T17DRAFT_490526 [Bombardia bombarda]
MSTATAQEILQLSEQAQPFRPEAAERRPSTFLSLAPTISESYPREQKTKEAATPAPLTADTLAAAIKEDGAAAPIHRTSSMSSDGSKSRLRFLKLGPVHWGEHQDSHQGDWHDVAFD